MRRLLVTAAESLRAAKAQPVASFVTAILFTAMVGSIILTNGRAVGSQREAISNLESVAARSITLQVDPSVGLSARFLRQFEGMQGVSWAAAFSSVVDAHNGYILDGQRVGVREVWTFDPRAIGILTRPSDDLLVSPSAMDAFGMQQPTGYAVSDEGQQFTVHGSLPQSDLLSSLEPVALSYRGKESRTPVALILIVATGSTYVSAIKETLESMLPTHDPQLVRLTADESAAQLQKQVGDQFAQLGVGLVVTILISSGGLLSVMTSGLVLMRRRDFGRRRALGASRSWVVALIVCQVSLCCTLGSAAGALLSVVILRTTNDPIPSLYYFFAVTVLAFLVSVLSAILPGALAASRDPIKELRVP